VSRLTRARDQYQAAFEKANDAMVIINDDARIVEANSEVNTIYGLDSQQLLGRSMSEFLLDDINFEAKWREIRSEGRTCETMTFVGADGTKRPVECSVATNIVPGQHIIVSRDTTNRTE